MAMREYTLSICISTRNRCALLADTLSNIVTQMNADVELVVLDGDSSDETEEVVRRFIDLNPNILYKKEKKNSGIDVDYDKAVYYSSGKFCWLFSDDDILHQGAVEKILKVLKNEQHQLVIVNAEIWDKTLKKRFDLRLFEAHQDRVFCSGDNDLFFEASALALTFIGCVVINREIWLQRNKVAYFGTNFIHVGVIFQEPFSSSIMMLNEPLIMIRHGNASWTNKAFRVWAYSWPNLIWSFDGISLNSKNLISPKHSCVAFKKLIYFRALGAITGDAIADYNRLASSRIPAWKAQAVLMFTPVIANFVCGLYCVFFREQTKLQISDLAGSKFSNWLVRYLLRKITI